MKTFIAIFLISLSAAFADGPFYVLTNNSTGEVQGPLTDSPASISGWTARTVTSDEKTICDSRSTGAIPAVINVSGTIRAATFQESLAFLNLHDALLACLMAKKDTPGMMARFWPLKTTIDDMFQTGVSNAEIKSVVQSVDVSDLSTDLQAVKTQMLALPQW